jgi:hypothetical protein
MSSKAPVQIDSAVLSDNVERGRMILTLSTKVGEFEFSFTSEQWRKLGETANWFEKRYVNGVHETKET